MCYFHKNFNPRSPRGLRLSSSSMPAPAKEFQSTQPKRAATKEPTLLSVKIDISIHAAQEGCDLSKPNLNHWRDDFNPRSPRGLRPDGREHKDIAVDISIHATQEGCDRRAEIVLRAGILFQSTQPKRAATPSKNLA